MILNSTLIRLLNILEEKNIAKGIIIFPGTMTSSARKACPFFPPRFVYRHAHS